MQNNEVQVRRLPQKKCNSKPSITHHNSTFFLRKRLSFEYRVKATPHNSKHKPLRSRAITSWYVLATWFCTAVATSWLEIRMNAKSRSEGYEVATEKM
jgi:hypothetical protein